MEFIQKYHVFKGIWRSTLVRTSELGYTKSETSYKQAMNLVDDENEWSCILAIVLVTKFSFPYVTCMASLQWRQIHMLVICFSVNW